MKACKQTSPRARGPLTTALTTTALALTLAATPILNAAESSTVPVGYYTRDVEGSALTLVCVSFIQATEWQGEASTSADISDVDMTAAIEAPEAGWDDNQWIGHFALIMEGPGKGRAYLILANDADTLTVQGTDLDSGTAPDPVVPLINSHQVSIFEASTLQSLLPDGGGLEYGDRVYLFDGVKWVSFVWDQKQPRGAPEPVEGWFVGGSLAEGQVIYPGEGFYVNRLTGDSPIGIVFDGTVPPIDIAVETPGEALSVVGNPYPKDTTLGALGIENTPGWDSDNDTVYIRRNGAFIGCEYNPAANGGEGGWFAGPRSEYTDEPIKGGEGFFILRRSATSGDNTDWASLTLPYTLP